MTNHPKEPGTAAGNQTGSWLDPIWIILTILVLVAVVLVIGSSLLIYFNPYSALNPFPPPTLPSLAQLPSATPTDVLYVMPSTWTPTPADKPGSLSVPPADSPLQATPAPNTGSASQPRQPETPVGGYTFQIRQGNPKAVSNLYHKELGCSWMGVGGRILDLSDTPVTGLVIKLGGELLGAAIPDNAITMAGLASSYGESGYEFTLSDQPIASSGQLWVQVTGQSGEPLSEKAYFDTYDSCEQNLILIDFVQIR